MAHDLVIKGGVIVDGTGEKMTTGDIAISDGIITDVGRVTGSAKRKVNATGLVVTPGFVDIHTHYDGQVTWDPTLEPSSQHGVTSIIMGNCGVGFAPVRPGKQQWLIELMEGVEDIPGSALAEGMTWGWETFPQYLDVLESHHYVIDIGTQIPHGAVRGYVMGERGARNEPASPDDIAAMKAIVKEAIAAGAFGFSTSRTLAHRAIDGEPVPGTFAAEDELFGIGEALRELGRGLYELAPAGAAGEDTLTPKREVDWMCRLSAAIDRPVTFALSQIDAAPDLWRELMDASMAACEAGSRVYPQIGGRPAGVLIGLQSIHPFVGRTAYDEIASLPLATRVAEMRSPERRSLIIEQTGTYENQFAQYICTQLHRLYVLGNPPNYEPGPEMTVAAIAQAEGVAIEDKLYDLLLADDGKAILLFPFLNYSYGNADANYEMLRHPMGVIGLADGGAHCGAICDASMPTWMLTHWTRDRSRGPRLPLEYVVRKQSRDTARLYGLTDRGTIEPGMKADLNLIDYDRLLLRPPVATYDLPAGGKRFMQGVDGYVSTIVSGVEVRSNGELTGQQPGRLMRSGRVAR